MAHPGGRPTKYSEEILNKTKEYLQLCQDEYDEYHKTRGEKSDTYERIINVKLPTIEGLAVYLDVHKDTLYEWEAQYSEFSDSLFKVKAEQQKRLIDKGLSGEYNPVIAKLILSANHGMKEKTDLTTKDEALNTQPILVKILRNGEDNLDTGGI